MPRAYSMDLRKRVVAAVQGGESRQATARRFGIRPSCVVKWMLLLEQTGSFAPKQIGGYRRRALEPHRALVLARIEEKPDLTIDELRDELAQQGIEVGRYAVWNFLKGEKRTFKKKPARQRTGPARRGKASGTLAKTPGKTRSRPSGFPR